MQITIYRSPKELPPFTDYSMSNRTYRYFTGPVLYPFGCGRSYSSYAYRRLKLSAASVRAGDPINVSVEVANTGSRAGGVVEIYLNPPSAQGAPNISLQGFRQVSLPPGKRHRLQFQPGARQLSRVGINGQRVVLPGSHVISIGGGQPGYAGKVISVAVQLADWAPVFIGCIGGKTTEER